jgi:hypothetical protein
MALLTVGSIITAGGIAWKYHRIPTRLWHWYHGAPQEPAERQEWTEAGLAATDRIWVVQGTDEQGIHIIQKLEEDSEESPEDLDISWEEWTEMVRRKRMYCSDCQNSLEDQFWGKVAEDD